MECTITFNIVNLNLNIVIYVQNDYIDLTYDAIDIKINIVKMCQNDYIEFRNEAIDENSELPERI